MVFLGNAKDAIPLAEKAMQLSPNDPFMGAFLWVKGRAYFTLGDYPNAIKALEKAVRLRPNLWYTQAWLVAAYTLSNTNPNPRQPLKPFINPPFTTRSDID